MAQREKMLTAALNSHTQKHIHETWNCPKESSVVIKQHILSKPFGSSKLRARRYTWKTGNFNTKMFINIRIL